MGIREDVFEMRAAFWDKFYNRITLAEMQLRIEEIMGRQGDMFKGGGK